MPCFCYYDVMVGGLPGEWNSQNQLALHSNSPGGGTDEVYDDDDDDEKWRNSLFEVCMDDLRRSTYLALLIYVDLRI